MLANKNNNFRLEVFDANGFDNTVDDVVMDQSDSLLTYFANHPTTETIRELRQKIAISPSFEKLEEHGIGLIAPLIIKNNITGLICFGPRLKEAPYEERELQQITILTNIISVAVNNASLYKDVEQLSYTDGMTELHNYRYFEMRLKEEVIRHKRTDAGLSLLILDVDHFKNYNDTLGHQAGDEVLRKLGRALKETVRENDIVARYGGEEFAVILPSVDSEGAMILAERIRTIVEKTPFESENVQPNGCVTVSIGEASLSDNNIDFIGLIRRADLALYEAKKAGRNRVMIYKPEMSGNK